MTDVVVRTRQGSLSGRRRHGVTIFRGIPYAASTAGSLRFAAPREPPSWDGIRTADSFGPVCWQGSDGLTSLISKTANVCDEDCLRLDIVTPGCDDSRRPVMVWIHGGGFENGSGSIPWYDGTSFATRGDVVVVTINYRLGAFGFLHLDAALAEAYPTSGINGILDQIAALEWVRANIVAFGGDPDNVTVFGESAGAMSIGTLLAIPAARGLFHRAILQSGAADNVLEPHVAAEVTAMFIAELGVGSQEELLEIEPSLIIEAQQRVTRSFLADPGRLGGGRFTLAMPFQPVIDGVRLPTHPLEAIRAGSASGIDVIIGTNAEEWKLFHLLGNTTLDEERLSRRLERYFGPVVDGGADRIIATYRANNERMSPDDIWCAVITDVTFKIPAVRLAEAQASQRPNNTFVYLFAWGSTAFDGRLGSCHALDIPFVWNILDRPGVDFLTGDTGLPRDLASTMHDTWWHFARAGRPDHDAIPHWPSYDAVSRSTFVFDDPVGVCSDQDGATRALWETS